MKGKGERSCLLLLVILTGFLLGTAHGQPTDTPTDAPTTPPAQTTVQTTVQTTLNPTTAVGTSIVTEIIEMTTPDPCAILDCQNGGTCDTTTDPVNCSCTDQWQGTNCTKDVNECQMEGDYPCDAENGNCTNTNGGYTCTCDTGYVLNTTDNKTCLDINECEPNPCENEGNCTDLVNGFNCTCAPGYTGTNCTDINDCESNSCSNQGTCNDMVNGYSCTCMSGYTGTICSIDINECEANPCVNGGTCTDLVNAFRCSCEPGYTGNMCMTNIDECDFNPCKNGGTCTDRVNGYECNCPRGFNGTHCENDIDACDPNPCENEVNCTNHVMSTGDANYTCYCLDGWMGRNCSEDFRECDSTPCQNGGTCFDDTLYYNCTCAPGFNGTYCEYTCPTGTFGDYCMESCTCVEGANCSNIDGYCTCNPVFNGAACNKSDLTVAANRTSPDDMISEDDSFTLTCQVNLAEVDLQEVAWYRNTVKLPSTSDDEYLVMNNPGIGVYNITIISAGAEDTGSYICTAVTEGNQTTVSSDPIDINVRVPGKIIDGLLRDDRIKLNKTAMLNCTAFSSEELNLAFERNGAQLSNDSRTTLIPETSPGDGGTYYSIILELSGIVRSDNGIYECIVMDQTGNETDRGNFTITVIEIPELSNPRYNYNPDARQLTIAWDEIDVNAVTENCTAFYNATASNDTQEMMFTNPNKEATIRDLTPFTNYSVSLICQNEVGPSERLEYGDYETFQGAPGSPRNVAVSDIEQRSALVRWEEPEVKNGELAGYTITARKLNCSSSCTTGPKDVTSSKRELELTGLTPGAAYQAEVQAYNKETRITDGSQRRSSEEESKHFTTLPDFPGPPENVESDAECTVSWHQPQDPNGDITLYTVTMNTYRLGEETLRDTTQVNVSGGLTISFPKSELPDYSDFSFTVTATNAAGTGPPSTDSAKCQKQQVGEPLVPEMLPEPSAKSHNSFTTTIPTFNDRNGPVSCYEVIVVQLQDASASVDSNEPIYSPGQVGQYEDRAIGVPYISQVMRSIPTGNEIRIGNSTDEITTCNTGRYVRKKRESTPASLRTGVNGPLNPSGIYTSFVRVYSPNDDEVLFQNGPFMTPVTLNKQPPNTAGIVGGIFGFLIAVCLILVIVLILYRRKKEMGGGGDHLVSRHPSNGVTENGHGMGMQNLGIEDVDEMIVKPIKLENLEKTIRHKAQEEKRIFWAEYKALPNRPPAMVTMDHSNLPANKDKNRYINIIAYDHTRVKLKTVDGIEGSDYINASYVNGYQSPDKFIAAQGPKDNTLEDFWRMIWEYNCSTVVMLTKCVEDGKEKCAQYWPDKGAITYGRFKVTLDEIKETAEYIIRSFFLSEDGEEDHQRSITQFHFLGWPDHGQPDYPSPMMCLIKRVRHLTSKMNHRANIVVHCSAGVGRTGTYIVIDTMLDMMKNEKQVDIYNCIHDIRQQRNTLVQSFVQYFFIHMALLEEHLFGHSDVGMSDFLSYYQQLSNKSDFNEDLTRLEEEFRRACKLGVNGTEQKFANIEQNKDKNRIGHILPFDKNVVKLERLIGEEFSDYINASYITGYQRKKMYIATQGPLPNTIADFWRMIWESQTSTIVMLTEISQKGHEMCAQYWPLELDETEEHGDITVTMVGESDEDEAFTIRDFEISHAHMKDIRKIRQFHFRGWPEVGVPDSGIDLMRLVNKSHLHQKESGPHPIVVHCSAGAGRTGVFIGLNILMSRMEEESMIDVFQTVRGLRQQRPHMVQDLAQFRFCYSAMAEYIENQSTEYQNFVPRV